MQELISYFLENNPEDRIDLRWLEDYPITNPLFIKLVE